MESPTSGIIAAAIPELACADPGRAGGHLGRDSTGAPTRWPGACSSLASPQQSKVAAYLYNGPEYLETYYAAFKAGLAPVNTNYRYVADELIYLFDNADAEAVVFRASFAETVESIRGRLPKVKAWIAVAEPGHPVPAFAERLRSDRRRAGTAGHRALGPVGRRPADPLHRRHHRHAQGRDVAAGGPVQRPGRRRQRHPRHSAAASAEEAGQRVLAAIAARRAAAGAARPASPPRR